MIGHVFAQRYQLEEFVGKGGMALVFRATDKRTGHNVAVKVLRPEFNNDEEFLQRFHREALAASKMSHHNIVFYKCFVCNKNHVYTRDLLVY